MRRDATIQIHDDSTPTWTHPTERRDWKTIDRALRSNARRRAALDADEARLLREAEALQIWKPLGMVNALDCSTLKIDHISATSCAPSSRVSRRS
jgi:hypothetical protein